MRRVVPGCVLALAVFALSAAAAAPPEPSAARAPAPEATGAEGEWAPLAFLVGDWEATGTGRPGAQKGTFSFRPDVQGHVLIRRNLSESAAGRHEDLLVIYQEPKGTFRALYLDNEGHVIHYGVTAGGAGKQAVFLSDGPEAGPRFRLTYRLGADGTLASSFELASPGSGAFRTYLEGSARRTASR